MGYCCGVQARRADTTPAGQAAEHIKGRVVIAAFCLVALLCVRVSCRCPCRTLRQPLMKCSQPLAPMPRACRKTSCRWGAGAAWPSSASPAAAQLCVRDTVKGRLHKVRWWCAVHGVQPLCCLVARSHKRQVHCFACVDLQGIIDYGEAHKHITATLQTLISQVCAVC